MTYLSATCRLFPVPSGDAVERSSKRSSAGTFGKSRRWSVSTTSGVDREPTGSMRGARQASETFLSDDEGVGDPDDTVSTTSSQRRRRRRHHSLSSSSASGTTSGPMPAELIALQNSKGLFPSPTQSRKSHRKPESDAAITAHLLRTASRDPRKIVPAPGSLGGLSPAIKPHPPSSGTPLKGGLVNEDERDDTSGDEYAATPRRRDPAKTQSKIEQMLGDGAREAGAQMELERKAWQDAVRLTPHS